MAGGTSETPMPADTKLTIVSIWTASCATFGAGIDNAAIQPGTQACRKQHPRFIGKLRKTQGGARREAVATRQYRKQLFPTQRHDGEPGDIGQRRDHDPDVGAILPEGSNLLGRRRFVQLQRHLVMLRTEGPQDRRQELARCAGDKRHAQRPGQSLPRPPGHLDRALALGKHAPCLDKESFTRRSQSIHAVRTLDEDLSKFLFDSSYGSGKWWLRHVQTLSGLAKAELLGNGHELPKLAKLYHRDTL
jgi:hypothetical protein